MTALTRALLSGLAVVIGLGAEGTVGGDWAMASNSTTHTSRGGEWLEWAVTLLPPVGGASELEVIEVREAPTAPRASHSLRPTRAAGPFHRTRLQQSGM
jgi:hypothetical protein